MAATESAVCEHSGVNWGVKQRSVTDQTRLTVAKPNSVLPCFCFSYY